MGLFIRQADDRSKLQKRLSAELQEKAKKRVQSENSAPDGVNDAEFMKNTKQTTSLAWVWILAIFLFIALAIALIL